MIIDIYEHWIIIRVRIGVIKVGERDKVKEKRHSSMPGTIDKALDLLECFSIREPRLTTAEIGKRLGLSTSTLYRYLNAMEEKGYLEKEPGTNRYVIGLHIVELAGIALSRLEVRRHGQVELDALASVLDMNANLGVLYQGDVMHIGFSVRTEVDRMYAVIGRRTAAHCTAMGKTLLAFLPRADAHWNISSYGWRPINEFSINDFGRLDMEMDWIEQHGYAVDRGEVNPKTWCVAAPVRDISGKVIAAMSISSSKERVQPNLERISQSVIYHAERLSLRLGFHGSQAFQSHR